LRERRNAGGAEGGRQGRTPREVVVEAGVSCERLCRAARYRQILGREANVRATMGTRVATCGSGWSNLPLLAPLVLVVLGLLLVTPTPAHAQLRLGQDQPAATRVGTEAELRAAWADLTETHIGLTADIYLHQCKTGDPIRESPYPMLLDGNGHTIRQTCFEKRVLRQDGTGFLLLKNVTLTRGGSDGPGAALTSRGRSRSFAPRCSRTSRRSRGAGFSPCAGSQSETPS
jgi:hypothetical protein